MHIEHAHFKEAVAKPWYTVACGSTHAAAVSRGSFVLPCCGMPVFCR